MIGFVSTGALLIAISKINGFTSKPLLPLID